MVRFIIAVLVFVSISTPVSSAQEFGRYVGTVQAQWLDDGRKMRLLVPFAYIDPKGLEWQAPAGWIIDGASIPRIAWSLIGGPFEGKYRDASVIHDVGCDQKTKPWESVHEVFYWAMRASGVKRRRAKIMYAAVYHFGPRWSRLVTVPDLPRVQEAVAIETARAQAEPGSQVLIAGVDPRDRSLTEILTSQPERADFVLEVRPPTQKLTESDFKELKSRIEFRELSPLGGMSLDEIQAFVPGK